MKWLNIGKILICLVLVVCLFKAYKWVKIVNDTPETYRSLNPGMDGRRTGV